LIENQAGLALPNAVGARPLKLPGIKESCSGMRDTVVEWRRTRCGKVAFAHDVRTKVQAQRDADEVFDHESKLYKNYG